jgi:hypothetical protein
VREVVAPLVLARLTADDAERHEFVEALHAGSLPAALLHEALKQGVAFSVSQIRRICDLFKSPDESLRRAAMNVLDARYLSQPDIARYATELQFDSAGEIRNRAFSLLP